LIDILKSFTKTDAYKTCSYKLRELTYSFHKNRAQLLLKQTAHHSHKFTVATSVRKPLNGKGFCQMEPRTYSDRAQEQL